MDNAVLVDIDVRTGAELLAKMSQAGANFDVVLWATFPEYGEPRLVFAASWLDQESRLASYGQLEDIFRSASIPARHQPGVLIREMNDPFIVELRARFGGIPDIEGQRLRGETIGGRFVEDGYIYKVT